MPSISLKLIDLAHKNIVGDFYPQLFFIYLSTICILWQCIFSRSKWTKEYSFLTSLDHTYVLVIEMSISGFMLLHISFDELISNILKINKFSGFPCLIVNILILELVADATIFFYATSRCDESLAYMFLLVKLGAICCSTSYYFSQNGCQILNTHLIKCFSILFVTGLLLRFFMLQFGYIVAIVGVICLALSMMGFFFVFAWSLRSTRENHKMCKDDLIHDRRLCTCLALSCIFCWIVTCSCTHIMNPSQSVAFGAVSGVISSELSLFSFIVVLFICRGLGLREESMKYRNELEFKRMFVRYISHEIRTPLNTAQMGLQVLLEDLSIVSDSEMASTVHDVIKSCDIAVNILNELLTFDKLEGGTLMLERAELNAMELISDTIRPFQTQARQCRVDFKTVTDGMNDILPSTVFIDVDSNKIAQVIRNMVSNALKFTPCGGRVTIGLDMTDDNSNNSNEFRKTLKVTVTDSGAGISLEDQSRLFKQVIQFQPGKLQKGGGSGLGLYISYGIVTLHGGMLSVFSEGEGCGSTFTLTLPARVVSRDTSRRLLRTADAKSFQTLQTTTAPPRLRLPIHISTHPPLRRPRGSLQVHSETGVPPLETAMSPHFHADRDCDGSHDGQDAVVVIRPHGDDRNASNVFMTSAKLSGKVSCRMSCRSSSSMMHNSLSSFLSREEFHLSLSPQSPVTFVQTTPLERQSLSLETDDGNAAVDQSMTAGSVLVADIGEEKSDRGCAVPRRACSPSLLHTYSLRILVVDDAAASRKMQCRLLRRRCRTCVQAEDGLQAVEMVEQTMINGGSAEHIDLILMDSMMPVMDGLQATEQIRKMGYRGIIIGVTGNVSSEDVDAFLRKGADAVLPKPLDIAGFDLAVRRLVLNRVTST